MLIPDSELIPLLKSAVERGQRVKMTVHGSSMTPFIRDGDIVELAPAVSAPRLGLIVLAGLPDKCYPLHRIVARYNNNTWLIRGDNKREPDGLLTQKNIIGVVTQIERNGRRRNFALAYNGRLIGWLSGHGILFPVIRIFFFPWHTLKALVRKFFKIIF